VTNTRIDMATDDSLVSSLKHRGARNLQR
jgi:hypothetical protein